MILYFQTSKTKYHRMESGTINCHVDLMTKKKNREEKDEKKPD